eukprot:jgi/Pico_ML_1/52828/g3478.t1
MSRPLVKLLRLRRHSVYEQLRLEEALLRASESNWCLLNDGAAQPAVVMGISGKAEELLHVEEVKKRNLQVIRRFSGGGTVVVDENTVFSTFVFNQNEVDGVDPFPNHIMDWTGVVYKQVFPAHTEYTLRENDYVFGQKKIGGNAQSIIKTDGFITPPFSGITIPKTWHSFDHHNLAIDILVSSFLFPRLLFRMGDASSVALVMAFSP